MLFDVTYKEIKTETSSVYVERGSKFIAYTFRVYDEKEAKTKINEIKKSEPSANHYCYAYVLNPDKSNYRINDDGEPKSTAGRQIYKQIQKFQLTNILIVVVRYFGGIKLGIPGLIRCYSTSALLAIEKTKILTKDIEEKYYLHFRYNEINEVMKLMKEYNLRIIEKKFDSNCKLTFMVPKIKSKIIIKRIKENHKLSLL
ncbi:MAG: YigZ family protein [Flavobacteriales bacterium TMED191]|nr:MAG: YigZ family protein [Flavobacteriales bacterium TMED191]|tara:strand:- start:3940 stop:4539 length:600 start_codon:yes stop_codon:yes gene_type:complete